ncbi:uncharacterized protein CANTADRAFT_5067 [Suhomyces tanzawaensis NRRL Y-17324]|uniref:Secreted protein CSS2 C-terminal domain-containing protein n=1 Tax=Suhomyces tanzawaensis NRRL Y-17324 TaxID=984487 RepID=A0A1E4SNU7_9ASCO|nr:uncharacterized protein CANTADRAFT_5067 [Suhomyces tanzawaensis NRRL Y-17324]ODV81097.1 hypothetical protein CANTADRAFT_5067 [Suhomyces tanzawaensis NRRL Y-17324]
MTINYFTALRTVLVAVLVVADNLVVSFEGTDNAFNSDSVTINSSLLTEGRTYDIGLELSVLLYQDNFILFDSDNQDRTSNSLNNTNNYTELDARDSVADSIAYSDLILHQSNNTLGTTGTENPDNDTITSLLPSSKVDHEVNGLHITERISNIASSYSNLVVGSVAGATSAALSIYQLMKKEFKNCATYSIMIEDTHYQVSTCTTGKHCDTQASQKHIEKAIEYSLNSAFLRRSYRGSFKLDNGGTWHTCVEYYHEKHRDLTFPGCPKDWCGKGKD